MPTYEFVCDDGHYFTEVRTIGHRDDEASCRCGQSASRRILTPPRLNPSDDTNLGYISPVTGEFVQGKTAQREDLAKSGCRLWEPGEREANARRRADIKRKLEAKMDDAVERTFYEVKDKLGGLTPT